MAWAQYKNYKDIVIRKNGNTILYEGTISMPVLSDAYFNAVVTAINGNSFSHNVKQYNRTNNNDTNTWPDYQDTIADAMPVLTGEGLLSALDTTGDYIEIYNKNLGDGMQLRLRYTGMDGGWKQIGFTTKIGNQTYNDSVIYAGGPVSSKYRYLTFGLIIDVDNHYAMPLPIFSNQHLPAQNGDSAWLGTLEYGSAQWQLYRTSLYAIFSGYTEGGGGTDPYADGGYSDEGGGGGDFDASSDTISEPSVPSLSAFSAGAIRLYKVTPSKVNDFFTFLWSNLFSEATIKKLFADPMQAILGLSLLPFTPDGSTPANICLGTIDTGIAVTVPDYQYYTVSMGSVTINRYYGSCLDYAPYTHITLVLPYANAVDLDPDEFMGKTVTVTYKIDILTGSGVVLIGDGTSVLMQVPCNVATPIPFSATDHNAQVRALIADAAGIAALTAKGITGGLSAPMAIGGMLAVSAYNVCNGKVSISHGGTGSGAPGLLGVQTPYLIIKRPKQCLPTNNANYQGYPSFITATIGNLSGYTKVFEIHLDTISATDAEKNELMDILKGGFIA